MKGLGGRNFQEGKFLRDERSPVRQGLEKEAKERPVEGKGREGKREGKREWKRSKLWVES